MGEAGVERLQDMFPALQRGVLLDILEQAREGGRDAMEVLLEMSSPAEAPAGLLAASSTSSNDSAGVEPALAGRSGSAARHRDWWAGWEATDGSLATEDAQDWGGVGDDGRGVEWGDVVEGPVVGSSWSEAPEELGEDPENGGEEGERGTKVAFLEKMFEDHMLGCDMAEVLANHGWDLDAAVTHLVSFSQGMEAPVPRGAPPEADQREAPAGLTELKARFSEIDAGVVENMFKAAEGDRERAAAWLEEYAGSGARGASPTEQDDIKWKVEQLKENFRDAGEDEVREVLVGRCGGSYERAAAMLAQRGSGRGGSVPRWRAEGEPPDNEWKARVLLKEFDYAPPAHIVVELLRKVGGSVDAARKTLLKTYPRAEGGGEGIGGEPSDGWEEGRGELDEDFGRQSEAGRGRPGSPSQQMSQAEFQNLYDQKRRRALELGNKRAMILREADEAYRRGDKEKGSELRQKGQLYRRMEREEHERAAETIFRKRNEKIVNEFKVDLHGMHVEEALGKVEWVLTTMKDMLDGLPTKKVIKLITGRGKHSPNNQARLLAAVESYLKERNVKFIKGLGYLDVMFDPPDPPQSRQSWHT